jgi:hypothetical protein
MKRAIARFVFGTSTLALATCWVGAAVAQSGEPATGAGRATLPTSALTLLKTKMSDKSSSLTLTLSAADAFPELSINCPNSEDSCTLRIEVSSQFTSIDLGTAAQMIVLVDGSGAGVRPSSQLNVNAVATRFSSR